MDPDWIPFLRETDYKVLSAALHLTPQQAQILKLFFTYPIVSSDEIQKIVPSTTVTMHRLKDRLLQVGVNLQTRYRVGYVLDAAGRAAIAAHVQKFLGSAETPNAA
jgi:DNA-binding response OmpR family regulator